VTRGLRRFATQGSPAPCHDKLGPEKVAVSNDLVHVIKKEIDL
jgi:hypothetical protein